MIEYILIYLILTILTYLILDKYRKTLEYNEFLVRFFAAVWPVTWLLAISGFTYGLLKAIWKILTK